MPTKQAAPAPAQDLFSADFGAAPTPAPAPAAAAAADDGWDAFGGSSGAGGGGSGDDWANFGGR